MKITKIFIIQTLFFMLIGATAAFSATSPPGDPGWPRVLKKNGKELTIYQPQFDSWQDYKNLHARFAIAVKDGKSKKETFGVAEWEAETVVDQAARVVAVMPKKRELRFPNTTDAEAAALRNTVEEIHPFGQAMTVSLDRILAYVDPAQQRQQPAVELNLDPPRIFYSRKPAILVLFQGEPQLQPVVADQKDLMFAVNTNWDIFFDAVTQRYYLLNQESWLTTRDLVAGPWDSTTVLPAGLSTLPNDDNWADVRKLVPGKPNQNPPAVLVSKEPAELILTQGEPKFTPIPNTKLLRVSNTESILFYNSGDGKQYFLTAGRWFRATSLEGPWTSASTDLPADFAKIPDNDPAAFVKASVPGTTEAKDAVLLASVPNNTVLDVNTPPQVKVDYNGEPKFQAIPSTTVQYATNTANAVFLVNGAYYCCEQGVWYSSNTANGPWAYCTNVPAAIYTIPSSHPAHNVTYVTVESSTPTTVVYTQTAGYSGEYVAANGVLMFGAGMLVGALINDHYNDHHYPMPYSYGYGARYGYGYGGYYRPPYNHYGPYRSGGVATAYNPNTGTYARGAYVSGPGGSAAVGRAYNPYTGARAAGARVDTAYGSAGRGAAYNPSTGTAVRGGYRSNDYGTVAGAQTNRGSGAVAWDTQNSQGAVVKGKNGNVYAGKDGNVYKRDSNGDWSSNTGKGWESVDRSQSRASNVQAQTQSRANLGQTDRAQAQSRANLGQTERAQAQPRTNISQPSNRAQMQSPSRSTQVSPRTRDLDSQAQARSRGNQLSQERSSFGSQSGSRGGGQFSQSSRSQRQPSMSGGRSSGGSRASGGGGGGRAGGGGGRSGGGRR